ncbi:L-type lectin-domain containing receptor kinase S.4 [Apostasia shenzhenica]|uniref:non-specific serine/threonine protein kinase n=1 Tax=Apostasia shenzhenica TaxID=1088818 RepID=A0A2I0B2B8_9ASPA|nr:L-type lectin-domain containing receptor kinase S.4 [Apostasia shenzhenica]
MCLPGSTRFILSSQVLSVLPPAVLISSSPPSPPRLPNSSPSSPMSKNRILHLLLLLLLVSILPFSFSQHDEFIYTGFATGGANKITLNGVAMIDHSGIICLTNSTNRLIGRAFYPQPIRFKSSAAASAASFSTAFAFAFVPEYPKLGGHGLAFVICPSPELAGAQPSQYLGLLNSSDNGNFSNHVLAVEFDTVQDFEFQDINDNHVGVDVDSLVSSSSAAVSFFSDSGDQKPLNLKDGGIIQAWIDYDGGAKILNVTLSPFSTKPRIPLLSFPIDLDPILGEEMFVGFSSSTGLLSSSHYLFGWSFTMNGTAKSFDLSSLPSLPAPPEKKNRTLAAVAASIAIVISLLLASAAAVYIFYRIKNREIIEPWELEYGPHRYSYKEIRRATNGFRELLGFGGFGKVYKGVLPKSGACEVAVKRISHDSRQGIREFVAEIASIGRLRHRHLVQLQGWCRHRGDLLLVYDYMPNGSLDRFIFPNSDHPSSLAQPRPALTWDQRFRILRGVASALLYLHEEWESVVIHRDVKASNVLLDADLNGRLGDFGLAKLYEHGTNPTTTRVVGTLGYLAPELTRTGKATVYSDVYAFGALVLEVVCGRRPIEPKAMPEELVLVDLVWELWSQQRWPDIVDPGLAGSYNMEEAEVAVKVGLLCSQTAAASRPSMREVVRYFDSGTPAEITEIPPPAPLSSQGYDGKAVAAAEKMRVEFEDFVHSYPSSCFDRALAQDPAVAGDGRLEGDRSLRASLLG